MCKHQHPDMNDSEDDDQPTFSRKALFGMVVLPLVGAVLTITFAFSLLTEPIQIEANICNDCSTTVATPTK